MPSRMYSRRSVLAAFGSSVVATGAVARRTARAAAPLRIRAGWVVVPADLFPLIPQVPQATRHHGKSYVIDAQHFVGTTPMIAALAAGEIDTGALAFSSLALAIQNAGLKDLRIVADSFEDGVAGYHTNTYLVRKDSPIQKVEDLKGKVLATNTIGSAVDIAMRVMLRKHGLNDHSDVTIVEGQFPVMKSMLNDGKVALIPAVLPFSADPELQKISRVLFTQKQAIGQTQMIIHTLRTGFLKAHHAVVVDLLEDLLRVQRYLEDPQNHAEAVKIVAAATHQPPARFDTWLFTRQDYYRNPEGLPNLTALQANFRTQRELGYLKIHIDAKEYADLGPVEAAARRLSTKA